MNLDRIFTSHTVFAANKPIRIYGEGTGTAFVHFAGITKEVISKDEKWYLEFPPMEYGGPHTLTAVFEDKTVVLEDIMIGEVYLFAGQSNMQFKMQETGTSFDAFETDTKIRLFSTNRMEDTDHFKAKDGWVVCQKEQIQYWPAIAYYTANEISRKKNIPVGAIACYQGASVIESWVPAGTFQKMGIDIPIENKHMDHTLEEYKAWNGDGVLYEYALSQVTPFNLSAVIWYQGESDTSPDEAKVYADELKEMIHIWRKDFGNEALPFIVVQIADYAVRCDEAWSGVQRAQLNIQKVLENVKTVISADVCENDDIHPPTKVKLSNRISDELMQMISRGNGMGIV